jgi:hypothetical protein
MYEGISEITYGWTEGHFFPIFILSIFLKQYCWLRFFHYLHTLLTVKTIELLTPPWLPKAFPVNGYKESYCQHESRGFVRTQDPHLSPNLGIMYEAYQPLSHLPSNNPHTLFSHSLFFSLVSSIWKVTWGLSSSHHSFLSEPPRPRLVLFCTLGPNLRLHSWQVWKAALFHSLGCIYTHYSPRQHIPNFNVHTDHLRPYWNTDLDSWGHG